jgi:hypothetical protein
MSLTATVKQIKTQLKQGNFEDSLRVQTKLLWGLVQSSSAPDESYYKAKSIVSEVSFYFDDIDLAREAVADFSEFDVASCSLDDRGLALEKIRCYLAHIQATYYYDDNYDEARKRIKLCVHFIRTKLVNDRFGCSSTLAWAYYQLGCCFRQLLLMERAERAFAQSIGYQNKRARTRLARARQMMPVDWNTKEQRLRNYNEVLFCNRRIAIVLGLGLGFCDLTRGHLSAAAEKLMIARALIAPCNDPLNDAYLALLLGNVRRCLAGSESEKLEGAEKMVQAARNAFQALGHQRYAARATFELALIHFALASNCTDADFKKYLTAATSEADEVFDFSDKFGNDRWKCHALIVRSRIARKLSNFKDAINFANSALHAARDQTLCKIDARIALAEAKIAWVESDIRNNRPPDSDDFRLSDSREYLNTALRLLVKKQSETSTGSQNEKIETICQLHQARSFVLEGNYVQASAALQKIKDIGSIEHKWIIEFWRQVKADAAQLNKQFTIDWDSDVIDYEELTSELSSLLLTVARQKHPTNQTARADFLNLERHKLIYLEKGLDKPR